MRKLKCLQLSLVLLLVLPLTVFLFRLNIEDIFAKPKPDGSLLAVLSSPDAFEYKTVTVEGYETCKFEGDLLRVSNGAWPRSGDWEQYICLGIDRRDKCWPKFNEYANRLVRMTGTFSHPPTGHKNYRPCWLTKISNIELLDK
jgi:hypothetical protein